MCAALTRLCVCLTLCSANQNRLFKGASGDDQGVKFFSAR